MAKTVHAKSGHTLYVSSITADEFEALDLAWGDADKYTSFYRVQNWDKDGVVFFYMARGYHAEHINTKKVASEVHVWYRKTKKMWSGFGNNFEDAINGAQRDGWLYA